MSEPLISVIIPAYRCAEYIGDAIDSALRQKVSMEIIVINDCSPDNVDAIMQRYLGNPKVIYIRNEKNMGAAESRNRGVAMAKGRYVAFLDADDRWMEGKLEKQLAALEKSGAVLCATARRLMTPEGKVTGRIIPVKEVIDERELLRHNSIGCSSVLVKTEVAREFPMHHEDSHEDYIMWLEIIEKYKVFCGINEPLMIYRLGKTGKSGSKFKSAVMTLKVYRYMGFGPVKSMRCFCHYVCNGIKKYYFHCNGDAHEA